MLPGLLAGPPLARTVGVGSATATTSNRVSGSFRDPSGFVFAQDGVFYRFVSPSYQLNYDRLVGSGLASALFDRKLLIHHDELTPKELDQFHFESAPYKVIRPERIPFVSYPFEWSFSQLKDAALATLRIQRRAIEHGMTLKDASAYNVQFLSGRPTLIDTLSFEVYEEGEPWVAYRQFCQHFLAPLALMSYVDVRLSQLFRVFIDGVPIDLASRLLPSRSWLSLGTAAHIHLHARAQRKYAGSRGLGEASTRRIDRTKLIAWLEALARTVSAFRWEPKGTEWGDYYDDTNYSEASLAEKAELIKGQLERVRPGVVWDLGANVGLFSRLAAEGGAVTVAFDIDPAAVEKNYLRSCRDGETRLLPLVMDLTNPSGGIGWAADERMSLPERGPADVVLALALIHHLAIGNNVPFDQIAGFFSRLGHRLLIEFVPKSDSQVQRLLASRKDIFSSYTAEEFERQFGRYFEMEWSQAIPGTHRTLYQMRRRAYGSELTN